MRRPPRFHNHQQGDDQMATRKINRSVRLGNEVYGPGREDDLAAVLPAASARQLVRRGTLAGDWGVKGAKAPGGEEPLSDDVPAADLLMAAGYTTREQIAELSKDQLVEIQGIGAATADKIIGALK